MMPLPTAVRRMPGKIVSVQYLRAIAAMMVVVVHIEGQFRRLGYVGPWPDWATAGVDIFFVISGFVMWITARSRHTSTAAFYWHRITRIVPLYWMLTSVIVLVLAAVPSLVQSGRFVPGHVVLSYLFLPAVQPVTGLIQPVLESGWTLNYEMYFYAVFGALLFLSDRMLLLATAGWLAATVAVGAFGPQDSILVQFYGANIILDFGMGMGLGAAFMAGWALPRSVSGLAIVLGFVKLALPGPEAAPHWLAIGLPALAIVAGAVSLERHRTIPQWRLPLLLGDASYALYLSHGIVLSALAQATKKLGLHGMPGVLPLFLVGCCVAATLVAVVIHLYLERPLMLWFGRKQRQPAPLLRHSSA